MTPTIFDLCEPRPDVLKGSIKDSDFAADLAQVINRDLKAAPEYVDSATFFANTYPTAGLKQILENVCRRLTGVGGESASIFRLDTQYGGGKTHALIALVHTAQGMPGVDNVGEFLDPDLLPRTKVRVAAWDGENADPLNGRKLGQGLRAYTPWGEIAYALAGVEGYESVRKSDEERVAPGADTIRDLFGGKPSLILIDEISVYLRKVKGRRDAEQVAPFLTTLFKAVESAPGAALVFTLALGKLGRASDAYTEENEYVDRMLSEAEKVAARKATVLEPTAENETVKVLRRRLFSRIDDQRAAEVVADYRQLWNEQKDAISQPRIDEDRARQLREGYPFHPALMSVLTDKLSTLSTFQRVRGMLRLLTQAVARLWRAQPPRTSAIHLHHLDPGFDSTRKEIITRLEMSRFEPAVRNDVAGTQAQKSLAEQLDAKEYAGLDPFGSFVARTILWHTFAFNEQLQGVIPDELRYSVVAPGLDLNFIDDARQKFMAGSAYLDDRPGVPLRFLTEANLTQVIRRQEALVDPGDARSGLDDRIKQIFKTKELELIPFPGGPYEVPDDLGNGKPYLALLNHDAASVQGDKLQIPDLVAKIFQTQGTQGKPRNLQNNLVFLVADESRKSEMKAKMVRRLALKAIDSSERLAELALYQQDKVKEELQRSKQEIAIAIQQCYRHLFYPTRNGRIEGATLDLGHTAFDVYSASETPGDGQKQVLRALADCEKLLRSEDDPQAPAYVRGLTPLKKKGQMTTSDLRGEYRKATTLPIMLGDENFKKLVRKGVDEKVFVYQRKDLLFGPGDPPPEIKIDADAIVFTMDYAKEKGIWPRPKVEPPEKPETPEGGRGGGGGGGGGPQIGGGGDGIEPPQPPPGSPRTFTAEAPLKQALTELWEKARAAKVASISILTLRVFDQGDAFKLLAAVNTVQGATKTVRLEAEYVTIKGATLELTFEGTPEDALPVKDFLDPQLRAATDKELGSTYTFNFSEGLDLAGDGPEKITERLARFASGAAYVEATAQEAS
jgi:hypothetical protein